MINASLTQHATARMAQRAVDRDDLDLILLVGTEVEDGFLVREKDCQEAERHLKRLLDQVRRLRGARVVVADGRIVTVYHAASSNERCLLRKTEERSLAMMPRRNGRGW